ncbi:protein GVQW3 [Trichonephila clavipes]|uniref:Protein GVQW3 n=1 Tax=Trichonephila clavipes TaxID=2585209 RepID=A0A8X6RGC3_TRICX|nr:protein GVQW3 [Trichonephila clavipes]
MCENTDKQICNKFFFKLGKTGTETYEMMKTAFGDEAMSRSRVFEWFRPFKEGRQSVNSDPRSGRPSTSRIEDKIAQVKAVVRSDRRLTVREIAQECQISVGSCDEILRKDLNMRRVSAKFVPRLLTEDKQFQRLATSLSQDEEPLKRTTVSGHCNHNTEFDTAELQEIPKSEFQKWFEDWKHCWTKCVTTNAAYFEGY